MAGFHGSKTITTAGTSEALVASTAATLAKWCAAVTIQYAGSNTIYGGFGTAEPSVSSTAKGFVLSSASPSVTIGDLASGQNSVNLSQIWLDTDTSGQAVTFFAEQL